MSVTDQLLRSNEHYAGSFTKGALPLPPARGVAVVACMDARLDVHELLGLEEGDADVIRNAGGAITEDAIRSLVISQRLLGTREIILIHPSDCGMLTFADEALTRDIQAETGIRPAFAFEPCPIWTRTSASRSPACGRTRSSPTAARCAASSTTSGRGGSAR